MDIPEFSEAVKRAVDTGLAAAAILDEEGKPFAVAGALDHDEARAVAALVTRRLRTPDLLGQMLSGALITSRLDDREVCIGIAARCVFVVVILGSDAEASDDAVDELFTEVDWIVRRMRNPPRAWHPKTPGGSGGSGPGPAELPVIELGVTVPRRGNN